MSKSTSGLPSSRPVLAGQRWGLRAFALVFLCVLLLWTDIFAGWTATPAHAATLSNPNPVLKTPSWLQSPAVTPHVLATEPGNGKQTITTGPIPRPTPIVVAPRTVVLTTAAQQVFSGNGSFELAIAAGSVTSAQIHAAGGTIRLTVNQIDPGSGGAISGRIFLGTYQVLLQNAAGKPLTTLVLAHPFTFRYHAPTGLQKWLWQDQEIAALWQPVSPTQAAVGTRALALPSSSAAQELLAHKDAATQAVWSVSTTLHPATTGISAAQASIIPAAASSTVTFNTEDPTASWGKVHDVDVGLSSGSVDYSYPLSIPPGPGGLTPPLNLAYSSGSVNETHNVQAAAPWVGEGWSLNLGSVSWSEQNVTEGGSTPTWESVWNINDSNGLSGQLIPPDQKASTQNPNPVPAMSALPAIWHTAPETHGVVQEVNFNGGPCWHVWLPNGTLEEFGCVDAARQGAVDALGTFNTYRWDLDLIVDRYGNQIRINYQRNYPAGGSVRDAVISSIEYDDPSCHQTSFSGATAQCATWHPQARLIFDATTKPAHLTNATGCQNWTSTVYRCDDPVDLTSSQGLGIAKAINTYVLNDVQVQVNGHILREYVFSYDQGGPQTRIDQFSGSSESIAGYLNLTRIQQLGTDGTTLNAPVVTMSYINNGTVQQHYIDKLYATNTKSSCPSTIPRFNSTQCVLWEQSYNSSYLSSMDNGMGWHASFSWKEAHNNTHGAVGNDPFACDAAGAQTPTSLCGAADDENWSRIALVGRTEVTNGVSSTWSYQYTVVSGLAAQECSDCQHGYMWGNQNDWDYSDYYNGQFTSFAEAQVTNPDNTYQINYFASTSGWGEANSSIHCYANYTCHPAPYWNPDPGMAGKLKQEQDYSASGQLMQVVNNTYAMNCPPLGVNGSQNAVGGAVDPGSGYLFSELDHNNPVVVCDPRITQEDTYRVDGVTDSSGYQSDARVVHKTVTTSYDGDDQGVPAPYDYGNVNRVDTTGNDVGGQHFVQTTTYFPDNNVNGNVYLTDLPAFVQNRDAAGTIDGCQVYVYGSNSSAPHAPVIPAVTQQAGFVDAQSCGGTASTTLHSYDSSGNPITATDPDGHQGCTSGSAQYSACASYDGFGTHLVRALNAKNQAVSYRYDTSQASSGYGQWLLSTTNANGQTTTFTYDVLGRLTSVIKPGDTVSQPTVSYTYTNTCSVGTTSPCLELDTTTRVISGSNTTMITRAWYDGMGRLVETQAPGPNQFSKVPAIGSLLVTYTIYDKMGRTTTASLPYAIATSATTGYANPDLAQARTVTSYDALGRSSGVISYGNGSLIFSESTTNYTVAQGIPSFNVDTSTAFEQMITKDAYNHQSVSYTDALGRNRYGQVFTGTGSPYTVVRTVQYNQDEVGNVTSVVTYNAASAGLVRTNATYNGLKERTGYNDSDLGTCTGTPMPASCSSSSDTAWKYTYDADGNVLSQTDPRNVTTYTNYDALDRTLCIGTASAQVNPCQSSASATYFYDSYNNSSNPGVTFPSGCTAPSGTIAPIGKAIVEMFSNAAGSGWRCYGYNARGETIANALSVTADGQTTTQNTAMTYNDAGAVTSLTYPDGEVLSSNYDSKGFLRSAYFGTASSSDPVSFLVGQVNYTNTGQLAGLSIGGTAAKTSVPTTPVFSTTLSYDGIQRPVTSSATRTGASMPFWSLTRTLDNVGNVLQLSTTLPTTRGGSLTDNQSFCYDALGRLTWAGNSGTPTGGDHCGSTPGGSTTTAYGQAYSYDAIDRMIQGAAGALSYNDPSHIHAATNLSTVPNQYASYDAMGNMTCRTTDTTGSQSCTSGTQTGATMSYDNAGRLASWTAPTGLNESDQYLYDNEGNRVLQRSSTTTSGATTTKETITFDNLTEVSIAAGVSTITNYYSVSGQRVAMRKGAILSYLVPDFLGSDSIALNADGSVQAVQLFAPYGQVRYSDQVMPTDYSFTGQRLDQRSGLLYDNARYYDPVSGRFTRADTVQTNTMGQDPYAYVGNSPETRTDPTGTRYICNDFGLDGGCGGGGGGGNSGGGNSGGGNSGGGNSGGGNSGGGNSGGGTPGPQPGSPTVTQVTGALASVAGVAGKLLWEAIDLVFNFSGMWHDVQTLTDANASWWDKGAAALDLGVTIFSDINMIDGEGEAARAAEVGAEIAEKGVADVTESASRDVVDVAEGACGGLSFIATTVVATRVGEQAIGTLKVGQQVWAYNPKTKQMELEPILHVWINHDNDLVDLTITHTTKQGKETKPGSEVIHTNKKHPFLTVEKGFLPVGQIKLGMHVVEADGQVGVITGWKVVAGVKVMYNLEVAQDHTFVVGVGQWVVHNCGQPTRSEMFNQAKRDGGIPTSQSPSRQGWVNKFSGGEPQRVYQFDVDGTQKYIVEHRFDPNGRGPHFHVADVKYAGQDLFQDGEKYLNLGKVDPNILAHYPEDFAGFR